MNTSDIDFQHRLFSIGEAADYLRISRTMVFKLLRQRKLTPTKIGTRTLISGAAIERLLGAETAK